MLTNEEETFIKFWADNREKQQTSIRPFLIGLSAGFVLGICLILTLTSGWYERANMVANTQFNPIVLLIAILLLSFFMAFMYRKFRWEMQEQRYRELLVKKKHMEKKLSKQP
ncbi:MAG: hypothetical protein NVSMB63_10670 [Sediminibacterium sp.]